MECVRLKDETCNRRDIKRDLDFSGWFKLGRRCGKMCSADDVAVFLFHFHRFFYKSNYTYRSCLAETMAAAEQRLRQENRRKNYRDPDR